MKVHVDYKPAPRNVSRLASAIAKIGYDETIDIVIEVAERIHQVNEKILGDLYSIAELQEPASFYHNNVCVEPARKRDDALKCVYGMASKCTKYEWVAAMRLFELSTESFGLTTELIEVIA